MVGLHHLHDDPDVFALAFGVRAYTFAPEVFYEITVSPWRYVSTSPTNNPGRFDLWIEIEANHWKLTIGNWKGVE